MGALVIFHPRFTLENSGINIPEFLASDLKLVLRAPR